jgi:Flp pilus assembly protein TadG
MRKTAALLRRIASRRERRGVAALEFGLMTPVFLIALAGVVDIGTAFVSQSMLDSVVSSAANYALVNATKVNSTDGTALARNVATIIANSNSSAWADAVVSVNNGPTATATSGTVTTSGAAAGADSCYCPTGSPTNWSWGSAVACGTACTGAGLAGKFVRITATYTFTPLFSGYGIIAGAARCAACCAGAAAS